MKEYTKLKPEKEIELCNINADKVEPIIIIISIISWVLLGLGVVMTILLIIQFYNTDPPRNYSILAETIAGIVGTCWTLSSVLFVYVAFLGQKKQLIYQKIEIIQNREELKNNTLELKGQREELTEQNKTITLQRFDNSFYSLLGLFNSIVDGLFIDDNYKGRNVFQYIFENFRGDVIFRRSIDIDMILKIYGNKYKIHNYILSHYFRTLYHLFKLIHEFEFVEDDVDKNYEIKKRYTSIVRAQLSSYEQLILFYNCLHSNGREKFKPLVEEYSIFNNIDYSLIIHEEHITEFNEKAFK